MQTWGVHTRQPWRPGWRGAAALVLTVGAGLASAALHGLSLAWVAATVLVSLMAGLPPETPALALSVLVLGAASAWLSCAIGARRAGVPYGPADMIAAPAYRALLSLAFVHAAWRLVRDPFRLGQDPPSPRRAARCGRSRRRNARCAGRDGASPPISPSCRRA